MGRSRASAKQAGSRFERTTADYLRDHVDDRIDRKVRTGAKDTGDIAGVRLSNGKRVVLEAKDYGGQIKAAEWAAEAETERINDNAEAGVVVIKRRGTTEPGKQWVLCTIDDLVALLTGKRP